MATAKANLVSTMLQEYGALTRGALKKYLPSYEPRHYTICSAIIPREEAR
ncbi:MAG: hypothetical protein ACREQN_15120 [Candidatus Binataceae bacterium]